MSQTAWEALSNQAVAAAGVVYFLALLSHLAEWALLRSVPVAGQRGQATAREAVTEGAGAPPAPEPASVLLRRLGLERLAGIFVAARAEIITATSARRRFHGDVGSTACPHRCARSLTRSRSKSSPRTTS